ncbi:hypothetical protein MARBORIA2_02300 [Methanobrevibacter arboriphilus]|uniref:Uncharacterized protein n=1 Tax=Methanobrevibacter arboriphilus TaxID=39441 RepID=A0ACA8R362_METAZ|nr:hypothetical protein MarbSA_10610 [Methanobrevibacter arboriphilus]GLI11140.1 hypothetical protein MARBORIA2_02300 [Methanobrevibacter arboriphilus]
MQLFLKNSKYYRKSKYFKKSKYSIKQFIYKYKYILNRHKNVVKYIEITKILLKIL